MFIFSKKTNQKQKVNPEEEYNKLIAENTSDLIAITDFSIKAKFLYLNSAYTRLLGYKDGELVGTSGTDFIHPADKKNLQPLLAKYLKKKTLKLFNKKPLEMTEKIEYRIKDKQGNWHLLASTVNMVDNKILFVSKDITEQKKVAEILKLEKNKLQTYLDLVGVMIVALDKNQKIILINKTGIDLLGLKKEDVIGKNWFDNFIPEEQKQEVKNVYNKLITGKEKIVEYYENEIITKSSERKLIAWHNTFLKNEKDKIIGILSSGEDITEKKKMEEKMISSAKEWSETFDSMSDGVSLHNPNYIIVNANQSLCNLLGKTKKDLIGKKCFSIFHDKNQPISECPMSFTLKNKKEKQVEIFEPKFNKWLSVYTSPITDKKGEIIKIIHIARDITERKKNEKEIEKRSQELEKFNNLMVGRESKMVELKKKIKELEKNIK